MCGVCVCVCGWVRELVCIVVLQLCRYILYSFFGIKNVISIVIVVPFQYTLQHVTSYLILVYVESGAIYARMCVYTGVKGYCTTLGCLS